MKELALVILKPDAIAKGLVGHILLKFAEANLEIIGINIFKPTRKLVEEHYNNIKGRPFFRGTVSFFMGKYHKNKRVIAVVYYGDNAVTKCRNLAGATNPEEAGPHTIRGAYGRITTRGIYENVVHVSSSKKETQREIKLWFTPDSISRKLYSTKTITVKLQKTRTWA